MSDVLLVDSGVLLLSARRLFERGELSLEEYSGVLRRYKASLMNEPISERYIFEAKRNSEKTKRYLRGFL